MRTKLAIKTLFRAPLKTLLSFLLLFAASFMMVYNLADYAMTGREFARSVEQYQGVVAVEREREIRAYQQSYPFFLLSDPTNEANYDNNYRYERFHMPSLTEDEIEAIEAMPQVSHVSRRYMTAGISTEHLRTDVQHGEDSLDRFYNYNGRFVIEATFESVEETYSVLRNPGQIDGSTYGYILNVSHVDVLAGREDWVFCPEYGSDPETIHKIAAAVPTENYTDEHAVLGISPANRLLTVYKNNSVPQEMIDGLIPGERYVIVGRIDGTGKCWMKGRTNPRSGCMAERLTA